MLRSLPNRSSRPRIEKSNYYRLKDCGVLRPFPGCRAGKAIKFLKDGDSFRAAACKYQTSPDSAKKLTSILFHEKNPYIELFSKIEFKRFNEFHFSRNRCPLSPRRGLALSKQPKKQILRMLSSLAKQDKQRN